jgi:hypothetical protein
MSDQPDNIVIAQLRALRRENADFRTLLLGLVAQGQRLERRMGEMRDDIELMLKAELMGRLGNFETRVEADIEALANRMRDLETPAP